MRHIFAAFLVLSLVQSALASHERETKYLKLISLYETASMPAMVTDFDLANLQGTQACVGVSSDSPETLRKIQVKRYQQAKPGMASHGPLFPGEPQRFEETIMFGDSSVVAKYFAEFRLTSTSRDLLLEVPGYVYANLTTDFTASFRKHGDMVVFTFTDRGESSPFYAGYCYR